MKAVIEFLALGLQGINPSTIRLGTPTVAIPIETGYGVNYGAAY